jgi:hypothetical protein
MQIPAFDAVDFDSLYARLKKREFNLLSMEESLYLMLSIVDESKDTNFLGERDEVDCRSVFELKDPAISTELAIQTFIQKEFEPPARKRLSVAATTLCISAYNDALNINIDDESLLQYLLEISCEYGTLIDGDVGFVIALDRKLPPYARHLGARHLVGRDFRSQGALATWERLEDEISNCPLLAISVIEHHVDDEYDPVSALKAFSKVPFPITDLEDEFKEALVNAFELYRLNLRSGNRQTREMLAICESWEASVATWVRNVLFDTENHDLIPLVPSPVKSTSR